MAGAPAMCGSAAMRSGAGLVELSVPECIAVACTGFDPCLMTHARPSSENGTFSLSALDSILERTTRCDVIVCGPGMGRSEAVRAIVSLLWREALVPAVFDADAISALATESSTILQQHAGPRIITPHEEFAESSRSISVRQRRLLDSRSDTLFQDQRVRPQYLWSWMSCRRKAAECSHSCVRNPSSFHSIAARAQFRLGFFWNGLITVRNSIVSAIRISA